MPTPPNSSVAQQVLMKITTGAIVGQGEFYQAFRGKKLTTTASSSGTSQLKGFFVPKQAQPPGYDDDRMFKFQFNPDQLDITREIEYASRTYGGLSYVDYIWTSGGPKRITFTLMLDATAGSQTGYFVPGNPRDRSVLQIVDQTLPRGVMPQLELLEDFMMPDIPPGTVSPDIFAGLSPTTLANASLPTTVIPQFNSGGVITPNQFYAPPTLIFVYGQFYLEGHLESCPYSITLWDRNLVARRATVQITFAVHEQVQVVQNAGLTNKALPGASNPTNFTTTP